MFSFAVLWCLVLLLHPGEICSFVAVPQPCLLFGVEKGLFLIGRFLKWVVEDCVQTDGAAYLNLPDGTCPELWPISPSSLDKYGPEWGSV